MDSSLSGLDLLLTDDHDIVRLGLRQVLEAQGASIEEAVSGEMCLEKVSRSRFDAILLDISLPRMDGLQVVSELRKSGSTVPVLFLSLHPEETYGIRALKLGAQGYLGKNSSPAEIIRAVRLVASGKRYLTAVIAERLADSIQDGSEPLHEKLTPREFEVFRSLGSGRGLSDTASILGISVKTVSTLRERILRKTGLTNNMEIIRYSVENSLA
jgi:two-component system, NarL family, invasion response regulator UvrY